MPSRLLSALFPKVTVLFNINFALPFHQTRHIHWEGEQILVSWVWLHCLEQKPIKSLFFNHYAFTVFLRFKLSIGQYSAEIKKKVVLFFYQFEMEKNSFPFHSSFLQFHFLISVSLWSKVSFLLCFYFLFSSCYGLVKLIIIRFGYTACSKNLLQSLFMFFFKLFFIMSSQTSILNTESILWTKKKKEQRWVILNE